MAAEAVLWDAESAAAVVGAAGVRVAAQRVARTRAEALAACRALGLPVAAKLSSPQLAHKSDAGAVLLGLASEAEAGEAFDRLSALAGTLGLEPWRVLVQEMLDERELEVFAGLHRDPVFGPVLRVGPGGRLVELLDDQAVRLCPIDAGDARAMLAETRLGRLLDGYRGGAGADVEDLAAQLAALSRLPEQEPEISEIDLNPLVPGPDGRFRAVDARVVSVPARAAAGRGDRPAVDPAALDALFHARSVVVIGASATDERKAGTRVLTYLRRHGYRGSTYVVHPTAERVLDVPAHRSLDDLPTAPELACVLVAKDECAAVLEVCGRRGVRAAIVPTSGFGEAGDPLAEAELAAVADRYGIVLCGPNTIGLINTGLGLHACFSQAQELTPRDGDIAIVAQSGALGGSLLSRAWERGLGVGRFVSVGNQARLSLADFAAHLAGDDDVRVLCLVIEGLDDGPALRDALELARERGREVVALKLGRSAPGADVALSHTGALAGDGRVWDAVFAESGVVVTSTLAGLVDALAVLGSGERPAGPRVGIVSTSGGACLLSVDVCDRLGLELAELPAATQQALAEALPPFAMTANPVDVTAQVVSNPALLGRAVELVLASGAVDAVLVAVTTIADPQAIDVAHDIAAAASGGPSEARVVVSWTIARSLIDGAAGVLARAGVPLFGEPADALVALRATARVATKERSVL